MNKLLTCFLLTLAFAVRYANAQTITGKIYDNTAKKPVHNAVVAILKPGDSTLIRFCRSGKEGEFELKDIAASKYVFMVTHPMYADVLDDIQVNADGLAMNSVNMVPKSKLLDEVFIRSGGSIKIKGDTISYTADSFKVSANANVEELLKKLPGIQVDKDGKIKAMGEQVEKVLVDGEEFFGDDPGMAVKNLRADAVKEVQVFDKKSEQAEFTGIDDGKNQKTINLKLKDDRKKGYFGKLDAAGGPQKTIDNRYNTNAMFNAFRGKRKASVFFLQGNTGQDGLSWQDNEKYGGERDDVTMSMDEDGGMMYMWRGGNGDEEPDINTENGFINSTNAGLHYSNKWNDKTSLSLSPKYKSQNYTNQENTFRQEQIGNDSILNTRSIRNQDVRRHNFKNNLTFDTKFDSSNSLKVSLKANFYRTESDEAINSETTGNTGTLKNQTSRTYKQDIDKNAITASAIFRHKFKKARRTLSVNADWNSLSTTSKNFLNSNIQAYTDGLPAANLQQNQMLDNDKTTNKFTAKAVYTEPLSKKLSLELAYEISTSSGINNQLTNSYSNVSGKYDNFVDSLSNQFDQLIVINRPSTKISYNHKKLKFNFGSGFGITHFDLKDLSFNKEYQRNYINLFPAANFTYTYKPNHSINFSYNGNTEQPSLNQLQPLRNNNDFFNQYVGNPGLKPSFTHSFNLHHNAYNFLKELWTSQSINIRSTVNSITNNVTIDKQTGKRVTQPINTNGNISVNFWGGIGYKLKKINVDVFFNPNLNFSRFADVINDTINFSNTLGSGVSLYLSKQKDKQYEVSIGNDLSFNRNKTSRNTSINRFYTNTLNINGRVYYKKTWSIATDYNFYARQKTEQFRDNLTNHIWNARLQKTFKSNEYTAYFMVRDILNQNIGIDRSYYGYTTTEVVNQRLRRYFMVGFTWDFKNNGQKPAATPAP